MAAGNAKPKVIVLCGPTAVGKTAAAIEVAQRLGTEIISADSMQVYRFMDIGTAKPTAAERAAVAHHLIDVVEPDEPFDAARYAALARERVHELDRRGKPALVAGGTGLYIKALLKGLFRADARDPELRRRLKAEAASLGSPVLHARLASGDPQTAARLHPNDAQRIVRALEVLEVTGQPISRLQAQHGFGDSPLDALKIGLAMDRDVLYARIERRVDAMLAQGLEEEVRGLLDRGYHPGLKSMQAIGYSHVIGLIAGRTDRAECIRTLKRDTRRYAKRQLTWFRADPDVAWAPAERTDELVSACLAYLDSPPPGRLPRAFAAWKKS